MDDRTHEPRTNGIPEIPIDPLSPTIETARTPIESISDNQAISQTQRTRGYRNTMAAGALSLSLLSGLLLLAFVIRDIVPQAQQRLLPTPEPVLYVATLWCLPCEQAGSPIVLWEKVGDGVSRGGKTGELLHNTEVAVMAEEWSAQEQRTYYRVTANGQTGWVPETFVKKVD